MVTRYSLSRLSITCTKVPSYQINNRIFVRIPAIYDIHFRPNYFKCNFDLCYFFGGGAGTAARGTLQDVKRERPKSRFAAV